MSCVNFRRLPRTFNESMENIAQERREDMQNLLFVESKKKKKKNKKKKQINAKGSKLLTPLVCASNSNNGNGDCTFIVQSDTC